MLAPLGFFGSAAALVALGWLISGLFVFVWPRVTRHAGGVLTIAAMLAAVIGLGAFYFAIQPVFGVGISAETGPDGGTGDGLIHSLRLRFAFAAVGVVLGQCFICLGVAAVTKR